MAHFGVIRPPSPGTIAPLSPTPIHHRHVKTRSPEAARNVVPPSGTGQSPVE
jgi:hypothetical protein